MLLFRNKMFVYIVLFFSTVMMNVPVGFCQQQLSDSQLAQSIEQDLYGDEYTKDSGKTLFGVVLAPGITVEGPGITGNEEGNEGFFFEKTITIAPDTDIAALLKIIESKLPDSDGTLQSFLSSLHYSFKEEKIVALVKVHFRPGKMPYLESSHVVIGNIVPEKQKMSTLKEELAGEEAAFLSNLSTREQPSFISLFGSTADAAVPSDASDTRKDAVPFDGNRPDPSRMRSCIGGDDPEPMVPLALFQRNKPQSASVVVPKDANHRIEVSYSVLKKLVAFSYQASIE